MSAANLERVSNESLPKDLSDIPKKIQRARTNEVYFPKADLRTTAIYES